MNKAATFMLMVFLLTGCAKKHHEQNRIKVASVGNKMLYFDQIPKLIKPGISSADSTTIIQNYINSWAKKELLFLKAEENLTDDYKSEIENQLQETRDNLFIYQYQRQLMEEKMDTTVTGEDMESYYATNEKKFTLNTNIVKALFIKLPLEVPNLDKIRQLSRSTQQKDLQQLEKMCYQFAEKFDDFNEEWVAMSRLAVELPMDIVNQDEFLRYNQWFETKDSSSVYLITFRDYRLRYSLAPYEYVKNDIKSIILNNRRFEFLQNLENGIYNDGLKANIFKTY
ncbi:MAG TPA: hypothetical protein VMT63_13990 [Bacteroidales bacterium]|nr:hypothetical protein [Bacteroidales bacterium]